jgi:hypothetical protein
VSRPDRELNCAQARALIRAFSVGTVAAGARAALDRHLLDCKDCRGEYRDSIDSAAELARNLVRARPAAADAESPPARRTGSRVFLFVALALVVASIPMLSPKETKVLARCLEGEGWIGEAPISAGMEAREAGRGAWVEAKAGGSVELTSPDARAELAGTALVMVEGGEGLCLRLSRGSLELSGPVQVTSPVGVFTLEKRGRAELTLEQSRLVAECFAGHGSLVGPAGERELSAGESWALDWTEGLTSIQ